MTKTFHYGTVTEAIHNLQQNGFSIDFNLVDNNLYKNEKFEIVDTYRYEGNTDPADEVIIYALQSPKGFKGILVSAYGMYSDNNITTLLNKITNKIDLNKK
jgi:hypothetical protein